MAWAGSNWVENRKRAEEQLKARGESLWRDVRAAVEDASRSFNALYGPSLNQKTSTALTNDHRIRVTVAKADGSNADSLDIDFNRESKTITASYHQLPNPVRTFQLAADHELAFILDENAQRVPPDDVSRLILEPLLFPAEGSVYESRGLFVP